ncbi:hypothetical protein [Paraburkholderia azotifigens]|uniref:Uncharacterized protein n=1 Tax=Paraburkholderia azotifigens TaxID=2057004 RepID=A0ABU9QZJ8_9BURK
MILEPAIAGQGYLTAGADLSSQAIPVAHLFSGCAYRQKMNKEIRTLGVQVISRH